MLVGWLVEYACLGIEEMVVVLLVNCCQVVIQSVDGIADLPVLQVGEEVKLFRQGLVQLDIAVEIGLDPQVPVPFKVLGIVTHNAGPQDRSVMPSIIAVHSATPRKAGPTFLVIERKHAAVKVIVEPFLSHQVGLFHLGAANHRD